MSSRVAYLVSGFAAVLKANACEEMRQPWGSWRIDVGPELGQQEMDQSRHIRHCSGLVEPAHDNGNCQYDQRSDCVGELTVQHAAATRGREVSFPVTRGHAIRDRVLNRR